MSVVANVAINVDSRGATQKLREVQNQAQQTQRAAEGIGPATSQALTRANSSASQLVGTIGRVAAAYLGLRTAQQAVQAGIQREESERRLTFLAKGYGEVARAQELAAKAGKQFGLSATESNQQFAQLYGRLRPLNVSVEDINAAFIGFNTAAKVSGTTAAESAGALLQLTQALGSGVLRGQELNSVLEQAPGLVVALTQELGAPVSQIRKLAEEGKITSDVVIRALKRAGTEGADELAAAMNGPAQAVKNLQNEFENFQVAATDSLIPAVVEAMKGLRELLVSLRPVIKGLGAIAAQTFGTISDLINAATNPQAAAAAAAIRAGRLPLAGFGGMTGAGELFKGTSGAFGVGLTGLRAEAAFLADQRRQPVTQVLLELMRNRLQRMETPAEIQTPDLPAVPIATGTDTRTRRETKPRQLSVDELLGGDIARQLREQQSRLEVATTSELNKAAAMPNAEQAQRMVSSASKLLSIKYQIDAIDKTIAARDQVRAKIIESSRDKEYAALAFDEQTNDLRTSRLNLEREIDKVLLEQLGKAEAQYRQDQEAIQAIISGLDMELLRLQAKTDQQKQALQFIEIENQLKEKGIALTENDANAIRLKIAQIEKLTKEQEAANNRAAELNEVYEGIAGQIAGGVGNAIDAIANGVDNLGDALTNIGKDIMAAVGKMLIFYALAQAFGALGGNDGVGVFSFLAKGFGFKGAKDGAYWPGGFQAFANGGVVTSPTMGLIGEGGEPEYVIPASKMRGAMNRYAAGARGSSVIPAGSNADTAGEAPATGVAAIDVRYTVERINNVDYVTADQFRSGMRQAAQQGAALGERNTVRRLQYSPGGRKGIGI